MQFPRPSDDDKERFRALIPEAPGVEVKAMFGSLGAFVNGNMFAGLFGPSIGVKLVEASSRDELVGVPGTGPFGPVERPMGGYLALPAAWAKAPRKAAPWIERAMLEVGTLPAKEPKTPRNRAMDMTQYLTELHHSRKSDVERIRRAILDADPDLSESIKWNAPNFIFDGEDRVTFRLQPRDRVDLVLHRGAGKRADSDSFMFDDTSGLIEWAAQDRGVISVAEGADLDELLEAILPVLHAWVRS